MDRALAVSYKKTPQHTNAQVDALRDRVQAIVDLERAQANAVIVSAGLVEDGDVNARINRIVLGTMGVDAPPASPSPRPAPTIPSAAGDPDAASSPSDALAEERSRLAELRASAAAGCTTP
jgi:hypothetical protein